MTDRSPWDEDGSTKAACPHTRRRRTRTTTDNQAAFFDVCAGCDEELDYYVFWTRDRGFDADQIDRALATLRSPDTVFVGKIPEIPQHLSRIEVLGDSVVRVTDSATITEAQLDSVSGSVQHITEVQLDSVSLTTDPGAPGYIESVHPVDEPAPEDEVGPFDDNAPPDTIAPFDPRHRGGSGEPPTISMAGGGSGTWESAPPGFYTRMEENVRTLRSRLDEQSRVIDQQRLDIQRLRNEMDVMISWYNANASILRTVG